MLSATKLLHFKRVKKVHFMLHIFYNNNNKNIKHKNPLVVQQVKDPVQLRREFNPWPWNCHILQIWPKRKKKKERERGRDKMRKAIIVEKFKTKVIEKRYKGWLS